MKIGQALGAVFLGTAICSAASAAPPTRSSDGILGVLKPDGSFRPAKLHHNGAPSTPVTVSGKFVLRLTISIQSSLPPGTAIQCGLDVQVAGAGAEGEDVVSETAQGIATGSGNTATCYLVLPYKWHLFDLSGEIPDLVFLSYSISALNAGVGRTQSVSFDTIAVPDDGATTAYSEAAKI